MKTILREQAELENPKDRSFSFDESTTGGDSSENKGRKKVTTLMAACHQGLEHNVSKILWRKVRRLIKQYLKDICSNMLTVYYFIRMALDYYVVNSIP